MRCSSKSRANFKNTYFVKRLSHMNRINSFFWPNDSSSFFSNFRNHRVEIDIAVGDSERVIMIPSVTVRVVLQSCARAI